MSDLPNWTYEKCPCGHRACNQYVLSNQRTSGFDLADARMMTAAPQMLATLEQAAEAIQHLREMAGHWSPEQRQAFLNAVEQSARRSMALAKGEPA